MCRCRQQEEDNKALTQRVQHLERQLALQDAELAHLRSRVPELESLVLGWNPGHQMAAGTVGAAAGVATRTASLMCDGNADHASSSNSFLPTSTTVTAVQLALTLDVDSAEKDGDIGCPPKANTDSTEKNQTEKRGRYVSTHAP